MTDMINRAGFAAINAIAAHGGKNIPTMQEVQADSEACALVQSAGKAMLAALRYDDGVTDEQMAIAVASRLDVDPVTAIEIFEAWIDAALKEPV